MNRSPTTVLDDHHSGSPLAAGSGTVTGQPLSSGATTRSALPSASAEHSASHFIQRTQSCDDSTVPSNGRQAPSHAAAINRHGPGPHHHRRPVAGHP